MSKSVVVPLDGSEASEQAIPFAALLAERRGATVTLMSVVEVSTEFDAWIDTAPFSLEEEMSNWLDERNQYLRELAANIGPETHTMVRVGRPADEIRAVAEDLEDRVVVMASHGRGGLQQFVLGSVALQVVHDGHSPVVTVHMQDGSGAVPPTLERVLFPLDGSDFSEQIVDRALEIVGEPKPALHLTRALESPSWATHSFNAGLVGQYLEATREQIEQEMQAVAARLTDAGYDVEWSILEGNAGEQILDASKRFDASLIAMATHGRGGLGRLLLGSVAQRVLNRATVPLLLIHPTEE